MIDVDGTCLGCPFGCFTCTDQYHCATCKTKYHPVGNGCGPCPQGCTACTFTAGVGYSCSGCMD